MILTSLLFGKVGLEMKQKNEQPPCTVSWTKALATCVGAFTLIAMVPPIVRDMSKPQNFSWALNAALLTCGILYLGVMLCNLAAGKKTRATCQRYSSNREHWDGTVACCQVFVVCGFNILEMSAHVVRTGQYRTLLSLSCILSSQHPLNILNTRHHQTSCVLLQFTFGKMTATSDRWLLRLR